MKKIWIIIIVLTLFLTACTGGRENENPYWKSGTDGITLDFLEHSPPQDVYAGESYPIVLEVRNRGTYPEDEDDDMDVTLFFSGFDKNLIELPLEDDITVEGRKSQTNSEGGIAFYEEDFDVNLYADADSLPQDIRVTACYEYQTLAPIDVCIDPNPVKNDEDSCNPGVTQGLGSQGAPIGVTAVHQESLKGKVRFTIKVSNVGNGIAFKENACLNPDRSDKDVVELLEVYLGDEELDCSPEEWVRLNGNAGTITCTMDGLDEDEPAFMTSLGVQLAYNYKTSVVKKINIKRIE